MIDILIGLGYENVELIGKSKIIIKTLDSDRISILIKIANALDGIHDTSTKSSSIGCVVKDNYKIFVKPLQKQGDGSAGKPNEIFLFNKLHEFSPDKIIFKSDNNEIILEDIKEFRNISQVRIPKTKLKTDLEIYTKDSVFNISIKQDNAEIWESADSYCASLVHTYVNKLEKENKITLECNEHYCKIKPEIGIECTDKEAVDVIFGDDILGKGAIIKKTFSYNDFFFENSTLIIHVSSIIRSLEDLKNHQKPFFHIRNDKTRNCGIQGIRALAVYEKRINSNVLRINKEDRID